MYLVVFEITPNKECTSSMVKVWVNSDDPVVAEQRAHTHLQHKGIHAVSMIDVIETDRTDYFPPCKSLDTLVRAEIEGVAVLCS